MIPVRQKFPDRSIRDIPSTVQQELRASGFASRLKPGSRVALGVGSRGIANIATIVRSVVEFWKNAGMQPFIFPAMGSHGAATAEGQADVLAHYGIHEATMGCPVISALDVVSLGKTPDGIEAFMDRNAFDASGVFLIGRVKWHTDFAGKIESGLFKMMAIGLGKFAGAQRYHTYAYKLGLEHVIRAVGRQVLGSGKILGGLAILEDANHNTARLTAVPVEDMERLEEENLALVKSWMGRIPGTALDILILDEIGKNYQRRGDGHEGRQSRSERGVQPVGYRAADQPHLPARVERAQLWKRRRHRDVRHLPQPDSRQDQLDSDADQLADGINARGHPNARSFWFRSRMPGEDLAYGGEV